MFRVAASHGDRFELHTLGRGHADADWALSDTKFRGRYDLRIHWGYVLEKKRVDIPFQEM